jgi:hypothetical protein
MFSLGISHMGFTSVIGITVSQDSDPRDSVTEFLCFMSVDNWLNLTSMTAQRKLRNVNFKTKVHSYKHFLYNFTILCNKLECLSLSNNYKYHLPYFNSIKYFFSVCHKHPIINILFLADFKSSLNIFCMILQFGAIS